MTVVVGRTRKVRRHDEDRHNRFNCHNCHNCHTCHNRHNRHNCHNCHNRQDGTHLCVLVSKGSKGRDR